MDDLDEAKPPLARRLWEIGWPILGTALLGTVLLAFVGWARAPELPDQAPAFVAKDLDGNEVSLASFAGRPVVLNFWATWCGPCRLEAPTFASFAEAHPDVVVLGVAGNESAAALRRASEELGLTYPVVLGGDELMRAYGVTTLPTTVFVRPDGSVSWVHTGLLLRPQLAWTVGKWW